MESEKFLKVPLKLVESLLENQHPDSQGPLNELRKLAEDSHPDKWKTHREIKKD